VIVNIYNQEGGITGTKALDDSVFSVPHRPHLLQEAVRNYLATQRSGTASTKGRSEVSRSNRKPWRQKGTGRARSGSARSPIWVGGGNTFGPKPRSFNQKMNRKAKQEALRMALSLRASASDLVLVDSIRIPEPKTKKFVEILESLGLKESKTLLVFGSKDDNVIYSGRNIPLLDMTTVEHINTYRILRSDKLLITMDALEELEKRGKSS